jgi:hypothetical protein
MRQAGRQAGRQAEMSTRPDPITTVRAVLAERRAALDQLEAACAKYCDVFGVELDMVAAAAVDEPAARKKAPASTRGRQKTVAVEAGSLAESIVKALKANGEPMRFADLCAAVEFSEPTVRKAITPLLDAEKVVRHGAGKTTRYGL